MTVLPNYLWTFKSDIPKGTEQDSCLWASESFFQGAVYEKNPKELFFPPEETQNYISSYVWYDAQHINMLEKFSVYLFLTLQWIIINRSLV